MSRTDYALGLVGLVVAGVTLGAFLRHKVPTFWMGEELQDWVERRALIRLNVLLAGSVVSGFCLAPFVAAALEPARRRWRRTYTWLGLLGLCVFLAAFLIHMGRLQLGGFDHSILVDTGWRQILGQRPYIDFPATSPPGFSLGIKYALEVFGVSWDANLYFSAVFACATFLWLYWLLRQLSMAPLPAAAVAFAVECAAMLTLCFWWYNNSVLILAAVFFLSCLAYRYRSSSVSVQISYFVSLVLLSVMKPNIAGLTIAGAVTLLLLASESRGRVLALTGGAAVVAIAFLAVNHVPVGGMISSYMSVARGRGGIGERFGYREMTTFEKRTAELWYLVLCLPLLLLPGRMMRQLRELDWRGLATNLLYPLALLIALYGLATNGDFRDVECTVLLAAGGLLVFGAEPAGRRMRRVFAGILVASILGDLYYGATRLRVYSIGPGQYFQWQDNEQLISAGFLKNMRGSTALLGTEREVTAAIEKDPGPYFFGPRLEFNYAVFRVPSPTHFPVWWHPGTAFPFSAVRDAIAAWENHRFETLLFLNDDFVYYPPEFLDLIRREYVLESRGDHVSVFRRRH